MPATNLHKKRQDDMAIMLTLSYVTDCDDFPCLVQYTYCMLLMDLYKHLYRITYQCHVMSYNVNVTIA